MIQSTLRSKLHVAIIMDGNGRWAERRGLPRSAGHRAGVAAARNVVEHAPKAGIGTLTLYAFSSDNWRRPVAEIETIFWLIRAYLRVEMATLRRNGARLTVIGRRDRIPEVLKRQIVQTERATAAGSHLHLRIAVDYSSRDAIARAMGRATASAGENSVSSAEQIGHVLSHILTSDTGDVDLLIRTGGEKRLSDFLLWESAYAELLFSDSMWPDFGAADLEAAVEEFYRRERRFGGIPEIPSNSPASHNGAR